MFQLQPLLGAFCLNRVSGLNSANFPEQDAVFPHPGKPSAPFRQLLLRGFELASRAAKLSSSSLAPALLGHLPAEGNAGLAGSGAGMVSAGGGFQATAAPRDTRAKNSGDGASPARRLRGTATRAGGAAQGRAGGGGLQDIPSCH